MSAVEAIPPIGSSTQPKRRPPGNVSKNYLGEPPRAAGDVRCWSSEFFEERRRFHEGNTEAARKSFRKLFVAD
jgi:hypothetical protein